MKKKGTESRENAGQIECIRFHSGAIVNPYFVGEDNIPYLQYDVEIIIIRCRHRRRRHTSSFSPLDLPRR